MARVIESFKQKTGIDDNGYSIFSGECFFGAKAENVIFKNGVSLEEKFGSESGYAPTKHASEGETYGRGTQTLYGHVKLSDTASSQDTSASGIAATPKAVQDARDASAPKSHTSADGSTYGKATTGLYGHVILSNNYKEDDSEETAATSKALSDLYDELYGETFSMTFEESTKTLKITSRK